MCLIISLFTLLATLVEVKLLGLFASKLGTSNMWLLIISTALIGIHLIRDQRQLNAKLQARMMRGELSDPSELMLPIVSLLSGFLLLVPGPMTDFLGLAMLYPPVGQLVLKRLFKGGLQAAFANAQRRGGFSSFGGGQSPFGGGQPPFGGGPFGGGSNQGSHHSQVDLSALFGQMGTPQDPSQAQPGTQQEAQRPTQSQSRPTRRGRPQDSRRGGPSQMDPSQVIIDVDGEVIDE